MKTLELIKNLAEENFEALCASGMKLPEMDAELKNFSSAAETKKNPREIELSSEAFNNLYKYECYLMALEEIEDDDDANRPICCQGCDGCFCIRNPDGSGKAWNCPYFCQSAAQRDAADKLK